MHNLLCYLEFIRFKKLSHWDELETIEQIGIWKNEIPSIPVKVIENFITNAMKSQCLSSNSIISFIILNIELEFQLFMCGLPPEVTEVDLVVVGRDCLEVNLIKYMYCCEPITVTLWPFLIVKFKWELPQVKEAQVQTQKYNLGTQQSVYVRYISQIQNCIVNSLTAFVNDTAGVTSLLVCGGKGTGKSTAVSSAIHVCNEKFSNSCHFLYYNSYTSSCTATLSDVTSSNLCAQYDLKSLLSILASNSSTISWKRKIVVIIDEFDELLPTTSAIEDGDNEGLVSLRNAALEEVTMLIIRILESNMVLSNVFIVGISSLSKYELVKFNLSRRFDMIVEMQRLDTGKRTEIVFIEDGVTESWVANDSVRLLYHFLAISNKVYEQFDCADSQIRTRMKWAQKLTNLLYGYTPLDLKQIIDRIVCSKSSESFITWKSALSVVARATCSFEKNSKFQFSSDTNKFYSWEDFGGYENAKQSVLKVIQFAHSDDESLGANNAQLVSLIGSSSGIVLHGPSGCGKTHLGLVISREAKMSFLHIRSTELLSKYYGDTEQSIRKVFQNAREASPCVLFFDEFDAIAFRRTDSGTSEDGGLGNRILSTFLNELDGVCSPKGPAIIPVASTNHSISSTLEEALYSRAVRAYEGTSGDRVIVIVACHDIKALDEALLRPGRLHVHVLLDLPTPDNIQKVLAVLLRRIPLIDAVQLASELTLLLENFRPNCADLANICQRAVLNFVKSKIGIANIDNELVPSEYFVNAVKEYVKYK